MYSDKQHINRLTALLAAHGVTHAVTCPGSRNAPIVNDLHACREITCHAVTDERSAAFYALGMIQATGHPVVVCVTSGSALLNLAPAVAEAKEQRLPLVVVSADRPAQWIGQYDGQTIAQPPALTSLVAKQVTLPEGEDEESLWYVHRLVNEAMLVARQGAPVHINVPISEPLFNFSHPVLPKVTPITKTVPATPDGQMMEQLIARLAEAHHPMIIVGRCSLTADMQVIDELGRAMETISRYVVVVGEALSPRRTILPFHEVMEQHNETQPDFVLHLGDTVVSKSLRKRLRNSSVEVWSVSEDGEVHDLFMHLRHLLVASTPAMLLQLARLLPTTTLKKEAVNFCRQWNEWLEEEREKRADEEPDYSEGGAVNYLEQQLEDLDDIVWMHYANSSAVRWANAYAPHYVWCNRGVNGIEGSLSTAAGFSLMVEEKVVCVIGDLSFFYDQNALWNSSLRGNLRILLLNNGGGKIFDTLPGLDTSDAAPQLVAGSHQTSAQGICTQNDVGYIKATDLLSLRTGIVTMLTEETSRPMVVEVVF